MIKLLFDNIEFLKQSRCMRTLWATSISAVLLLHLQPFARADSDPEAQSTSKAEITEAEAVSLADNYVRERGWGKSTSVLRTVSKWYRVEYGEVDGTPRFVLVSPQSGKVEDPLPR
ncbi:MAG: hypothetical protein J5J00_03920 [Deltaproteobacteria bacterium]|nr:hypothetical protein [Deltaproteobacteria bacterium]